MLANHLLISCCAVIVLQMKASGLRVVGGFVIDGNCLFACYTMCLLDIAVQVEFWLTLNLFREGLKILLLGKERKQLGES